MSKTGRIFGLDLLRAVAIILVVLGHGKMLLVGTWLEGFPYVNPVDGVDLFFVLSGYLIGGILIKDLISQERVSILWLANFWKRRWFRTLPAYYLVLFLNYLVVKYEVIQEDISQFSLHFLTFTHNFSGPFHGFFWESWSLSIEEWFYLIAPLAMLVVSRMVSGKWAYIVIAVGMIVFSVWYRADIYSPDFSYYDWDVRIRKVVLTRFDSIGMGLVMAWLIRYYKSTLHGLRFPLFILGFGLLVGESFFNFDTSSFYKQVLYFLFLPCVISCFLPLLITWQTCESKVGKSITHISKISYSMYLINLALVGEVLRDNCMHDSGQGAVRFYLLYWFIVILASSFMYKFVELPFLKLREVNYIQLIRSKWSKH